LKKIRKNLQNAFKSFFYKAFAIFHGKIKGKIVAKNDPRVQIKLVEQENNIKYKIYIIKNARLYTDRIHDAAVILNNHVVEGPSYQLRTINNVEVDKNIVFQKGTPRKKKVLKGKVLSLLTGGAGNENYSHWLFDVLPRLALCEKLLDISKIDFFLLPSLEKKFQKETLNLLNIQENKLLSSKTYRHIIASELIVTDHPYCINNDASRDIMNIPIWISEWLKNQYIKKEINKNFDLPQKIFIDRNDASSNTKNLRKITNEDAVKDFLESNGFISLKLSNQHFKRQVEIFNNAKIIVGLHGAGLANVCFCKAGTKIVELKSNSAGKQYENLAIKNKLIYKSISSQPTKFDYNNQFGHISVSIEKLNKIIESLN